MKPLSYILSLFLVLPLYVSAQDPSFWDDPYTGTPEDTVSEPTFWDDPYIGIKPDESPEPGLWDDPYYTEPEITVLTINDQGLPPEAAQYMAQAKVVDIILERNLVGGMYNTLCLPFDVPSIEESPLQGASVLRYSMTLQEGSQMILYFDPVDEIIAGVPYLIMPAVSITEPMRFNNAMITTIEGQKDEGVILDFVGILDPYQIPYDHATMFLGANNTLYYSNNDGTSMRGLRAYFAPHYNAKIPARLRIGRPGEIYTDLDRSLIADYEQSMKIVFDGQLYVLYKGKTYNIFGNLIKQ